MKFLFVIIAGILLATPLFAQDNAERSQEGRTQETEQQPAEQAVQDDPSPFIDEDGDGINDRLRRGAGRSDAGRDADRPLRRRQRDRFIDHDGDGINDHRSGGTGIRKGRRHGAPKGGGR